MADAQFGRLSVTGPAFRKSGHYYAPCLCECGNQKDVRRDHLRTGKIKSCGCWHDEAAAINNITHGHSQRNAPTPEYRAWLNMNDRCYRESSRSYPGYGGRGVHVCDEWRRDFAAFFAHVGPKPRPDMSIDRIRVNGNYEPGNVRWADRITQARNVRRVERFNVFGESLTLAEMADKSVARKGTIWYRIKRAGWSAERAVQP